MFHGVTGIPFGSDSHSGAYDELTLWEQIDNGAQYTPAKKWLFCLPIALCVFNHHCLPFPTHMIKFSRINTLHRLQPFLIHYQSLCPDLCPHTQTSTGKSYNVVPLSPIFTVSLIRSFIGNGYALCPTFQPLPLPASHLLVLLLLSEVLLELYLSSKKLFSIDFIYIVIVAIFVFAFRSPVSLIFPPKFLNEFFFFPRPPLHYIKSSIVIASCLNHSGRYFIHK